MALFVSMKGVGTTELTKQFTDPDIQTHYDRQTGHHGDITKKNIYKNFRKLVKN